MAQLPYKNYNQTKIQTSDQLSLIILLYDGLSRFLRKGQRKIVEKDYEGAHHYLTRSRDIVNELLVTLRVEEGNKVAQNLRSLYVFMIYSFNSKGAFTARSALVTSEDYYKQDRETITPLGENCRRTNPGSPRKLSGRTFAIPLF